MKKNKKKSGGYYLELLPSDVQSKIVANLSQLYPNEVAEKIVSFKSHTFANMADMIASLFNWDKSNEGSEYWEGIINKKFDGKDLIESVSELFDIRVLSIQDVVSERLNDMLTEVFGSQLDERAKLENDIKQNPNAYKSGKQYIVNLSESEKENFFENIEAIGRNVEDYLKNRYHSFNDFIGSAFPFFATKEGVKYWAEIRNREIAENLNDVLAELNIRKSE